MFQVGHNYTKDKRNNHTKEELRTQLELEDEILEVIDNQDDYTRSDLQGRVMAIVRKAMQAGAKIYQENNQ